MTFRLAAPANHRFAQSRQLAERLEKVGADVFVSDRDRYLLLLQDAPGEVIELGRPTRGSRMFKVNARRRNIPVVRDFEAFAVDIGLQDCIFWCVGIPNAKVSSEALEAGLKAFNSLLNTQLSELRKRCSFELLLLTIHPRFDPVSGLFDLHAHFIARIPPAAREAAKRRLTAKFSKVDLPDYPIRKAGAVATYMLWGIWRESEMLTWPDDALAAAWGLSRKRCRLFRAGGGFAKWRSAVRPITSKANLKPCADIVAANRKETAHSPRREPTTDRILARVLVRYGSRRVAALLCENRTTAGTEASCPSAVRSDEYSSANSVVTQEREPLRTCLSVLSAQQGEIDSRGTGEIASRSRRLCRAFWALARIRGPPSSRRFLAAYDDIKSGMKHFCVRGG